VNSDRFLFQIIYQRFPHPSLAVYFMQFWSFIGSFALIWILLLAWFFIKEQRIHKEFAFLFALLLIMIVFFIDVTAKNAFMRERPLKKQYVSAQNHWNRIFPIKYFSPLYPNDYSFPSGHAASSFGAAILFSWYHRKKIQLVLIIATLISFSRIYLGYHYPLDVIIGALFGGFIGYTIVYVWTHLYRK
jgi:undecaprenyl-diphosphatase